MHIYNNFQEIDLFVPEHDLKLILFVQGNFTVEFDVKEND